MPNSIEFRESCATGDSLRYLVTPHDVTFPTGGRGGGKSQQFTGGGSRIGVTAEANKVLAAAWNMASLGARQGFRFMESGVIHVTLISTTGGKLEAWRGDYGTGTLLATSTNILFFTGDYPHVEAKVAIHDTTGSVQVRVNEALVTWSSSLAAVDTRNGATGVIDQLEWGTLSGISTMCDIVSQFAGSDWIGDVRVLYQGANAAGASTDGVATGAGTILQCVDEFPHNGDTDYILQDNVGLPKAATFRVATLPANVLSIVDVAPVVLSRKDDAGTNLVRGIFKSGATTDDGGADVAAISSYTNIFGSGPGSRHYQNDPATGLPYTVANFNTAGYVEVGRKRVA